MSKFEDFLKQLRENCKIVPFFSVSAIHTICDCLETFRRRNYKGDSQEDLYIYTRIGRLIQAIDYRDREEIYSISTNLLRTF